jgi:hypothetical protein
MALAAGFVEFIVLSGRPVEAVAGLAQGGPLESWLSLVLNYHRLVRVRPPAIGVTSTLAISPKVPLAVFRYVGWPSEADNSRRSTITRKGLGESLQKWFEFPLTILTG